MDNVNNSTGVYMHGCRNKCSSLTRFNILAESGCSIILLNVTNKLIVGEVNDFGILCTTKVNHKPFNI